MTDRDRFEAEPPSKRFAAQVGDKRAPWVTPTFKKFDVRNAEVGTSTGADLNNTSNS